MTGAEQEFRLRLPHGGPVARGWLLDRKGASGGRQFKVLRGSPVRREETPSFAARTRSYFDLRRYLIDEGSISDSANRTGYLETAKNITFESPSAAASVLLGRAANGFLEWKSLDGHPLADFLPASNSGPNRTWLVRSSDIAGIDLARRLWLPDGLVSLAASQLRTGVKQGIQKDQLRTYVEEDYSALSYSRRSQMVDELHAFLSKMKPGDTVCTISVGDLYVGEITGDVSQQASEGGRSNLRRPAEWQSAAYPYDELPEELQQKLSILHDVVDLTSVAGLVAGLGRSSEELEEVTRDRPDESSAEIAALVARRELELREPTNKLAKDLLMHDIAWLAELRAVLWDERQLILYGPPGTGKTHMALKLAEFFGRGPERVQLVQFHPSYSYEDFFEGFRPQEDEKTREVALRITAGPLRALADFAGREGNRHIPHFLVIDEINRANLANVFGELYFLLEYRNKSVRLTYSGDDFALPPNLFVIGTMNTADRSIALVDAAMRRRFAFIELSPRVEPTKGLLRRWLADEGRDSEPAELLDALNARIADPDFQIGPAYLMKKAVYRPGGLERAWRTKILPLLEEHYYGEGVQIEQRYGLAALRAGITAGGTPAGPPG